MTVHQKLASLLLRLWPNLPTETAAAIAMGVDDIPEPDAIRALEAYWRTDQTGFAPAPGRLRDLVLGNPKAKALEAWNGLRVQRWRGYDQAQVQDLVAEAALQRIGGRHRLSQMSTCEVSYVQREFVAAYRAESELALLEASSQPKLTP